jgi:hypothetical protein
MLRGEEIAKCARIMETLGVDLGEVAPERMDHTVRRC